MNPIPSPSCAKHYYFRWYGGSTVALGTLNLLSPQNVPLATLWDSYSTLKRMRAVFGWLQDLPCILSLHSCLLRRDMSFFYIANRIDLWPMYQQYGNIPTDGWCSTRERLTVHYFNLSLKLQLYCNGFVLNRWLFSGLIHIIRSA